MFFFSKPVKKKHRLAIRKSSNPSLILNSKVKNLGLSKSKFRYKPRKLSLKLKNKIKLAFKARIKKLILESKLGKFRIRKKKSYG
jgi:hypothetical protein